jgi:nicotinamidase-related amidase
MLPRELLDVEQSLLIVVDLQEGWFSDRLTDAMRERLFSRAAWLTAAARALQVPIVITEEDAARNGRTAEVVAQHLPPDAPRFSKVTFDLASTPQILTAVEETGRRTAVLVGTETDVCIAQSALGLTERGFRVIVVSDAVASPDEDHHLGLQRLQQHSIELMTVKSVFYEWTRTVPRARELKAQLADLHHGGLRL